MNSVVRAFVSVVLVGFCACPKPAESPVVQRLPDAGAELPRLPPGVARLPGGGGLISTGPRVQPSLPPEFLAAEQACPHDEHGRFCALVSDELVQLQNELTELEKGETTDGLCHASTGLMPPLAKIDVELSSPDGTADLGLLPVPHRVQVSGSTVLKREQVFGACALLDGRPALVQVGPVRDGRQIVTVRRRLSTPLSVVVKTGLKAPVSGWLHAIPPFDWPDTVARPVPLSFVGHTAEAPERVPKIDNDLGVWSVVSVKVGRLVAAQMVAPNEQRVVLTPGPPATLRVRVTAFGKPVPLSQAWFEDVLPDSPMECVAFQSWGRWGLVDLDGATTAVLEVPPGARRCVFLQTESGDVVATRAPTSAGTSARAVWLPLEAPEGD